MYMELVFQRVQHGLSRFSFKLREGTMYFFREWRLALGLYIVFYISHRQSRQIPQQRIFPLKL